jgi:hypothetical protein
MRAFLSQVHVDPDLAVERFVLEHVDDANDGSASSD